jgi:uncharacterized protein (TIGR03905 family)
MQGAAIMGRYITQGVCSSIIKFEIEEGRIKNLEFEDGCEGNLKALSMLAEGMSAEEAISRFEGIDCEGKGTSCPDQLAKALREYAGRK